MKTQNTNENKAALQKQLRVLLLLFSGLGLFFLILGLTLPIYKLHPLAGWVLEKESLSILGAFINISKLSDGDEETWLGVLYFASIILPMIIAIRPLTSLYRTASKNDLTNLELLNSKRIDRSSKVISVLCLTSTAIAIIFSVVYKRLDEEENIGIFFQYISSYNEATLILIVCILIAIIVCRFYIVKTKEELVQAITTETSITQNA